MNKGFDLDSLVRPNIRKCVPYATARNDFAGMAEIFLDANENSFGSPLGGLLNRYPDPLQQELKERMALLRGTGSERIFLGNGSDEAIDLLFRIFCEPGKDNIITCTPTYGMYAVSAAVNDAELRAASLEPDFVLSKEAVLQRMDTRSKLLILCSPNNPTGNDLDRNVMLQLCREFKGIVAVDEAYIEFSRQPSLLNELDAYPNLVVLQTFSKAWGLAGIRLGMAFASEEIITLFNRVKPPYNVSRHTQEAALKALDSREKVENTVREIVRQRDMLAVRLEGIGCVTEVFPSASNFLLVRFADPVKAFMVLKEKGIIVRDRSRVNHCGGCLRITVGTESQNETLIRVLTNV